MKIKHIIVVAAALAMCAGAQAQNSIGLKAGISGGWIQGVVLTPGARVIPHPALYGGVTGTFYVSDNVFAQAELLYAGKGHSEATTVGRLHDKYSLNMGYLQLPAMVGITLADGRCSVMAGPEFGLLLHASDIDNIDGRVSKTNCKDICKPFNFAIALQANYMILPNLGVDIKFDWGLTKTFKDEAYKILDIKGNAHNLNVQLGICYRFELD